MFRFVLVIPVLTLALFAGDAGAVGDLVGHCRFEKIKGQPAAGYNEQNGIYEDNLFFSASTAANVTPPCRRLGTSCQDAGGCNTNTVTWDGCFCMASLPAGTHSLLLARSNVFIGPKVVPNVVIHDGQTTTLYPELAVDYSTYFRNDWTGNDSAWYQTFVATGTGVRGIGFTVAGGPSSDVTVTLLKDNGNADVRAWQPVASRVAHGVVGAADSWVRFRSKDAPLLPGTRYAVSISGSNLQPYKRNKDSLSYAGGRAYNSQGQAQNFDINVTVFTDNDGTRMTMNKRTSGLGAYRDGNFGTQWCQTFTAEGKGLAAADIWAIGLWIEGTCENGWDFEMTWKIRQGGPGGPQIGPTKTTKAGWEGYGSGLHGVSYNPDEVPLVKGQVYAIEMTFAKGPACTSPGYNPYVMDDDSYDGGTSYFNVGGNWVQRFEDLSMSIMEYSIPPREIANSPDKFDHTVYRGDALPNDVFNVWNNGSECMPYTITDDAPWMTVAPAQGESCGEHDPITITYNLSGLTCGTYTGTISIASDQAANSPKHLPVTIHVGTVRPDFDCDQDVDQEDFAFIQRCLTGTGILNTDAACAPADFNGDGPIDPADLAVFRNCMSGPNIPADRNCD